MRREHPGLMYPPVRQFETRTRFPRARRRRRLVVVFALLLVVTVIAAAYAAVT